MALKHLNGCQERGRRDFAVGDIAPDDGLGLGSVLANHGCGILAAEGPATLPRFAARAWRDMPFAPTDPAVAIAHLDDDRLKLGESAI